MCPFRWSKAQHRPVPPVTFFVYRWGIWLIVCKNGIESGFSRPLAKDGKGDAGELVGLGDHRSRRLHQYILPGKSGGFESDVRIQRSVHVRLRDWSDYELAAHWTC